VKSRCRRRAGAAAARRGEGLVTTLAVLEQRDGVCARSPMKCHGRAAAAVASKPWSAPGRGPGRRSSRQVRRRQDRYANESAFAKYAPRRAPGPGGACELGGHRCIVFAASATGKDLAPRVAAKLGVAVAADITDLATDGGAIVVTRPVYAGKALLKVKVAAQPACSRCDPTSSRRWSGLSGRR